jgi:carboxymethylenebutenolidase
MALHGSGGLWNSGHGNFPQLLADRGFTVFLPHFFEATGTSWARPETIRQHFPEWMQTISDAIDFAVTQPAADPSRVGIIGFSLGAYLGLAVGSQQPRIKAVVDFFGGLPDELAGEVKHVPAVLILHGERDNIVPVTEAYKLERLLQKHQAAHEMKIYRNAGHGLSGLDMLDAGQRTYFFLKRYLG